MEQTPLEKQHYDAIRENIISWPMIEGLNEAAKASARITLDFAIERLSNLKNIYEETKMQLRKNDNGSSGHWVLAHQLDVWEQSIIQIDLQLQQLQQQRDAL